MKKKILIIAVLGFLHSVHGQEVLSSQGGSHGIQQQMSVNYTVGEAVILTVSDSTNNDLTQGFHQTNWTFLFVEDHESSFVFSAYPNPFVDELIIETSEYLGVRYQIVDVTGKIVADQSLISKKTSISTSHLALGAYSLVLRGKKKFKTIKLIKNY